ncbi:MAG: hypothetical protein K0S55_824 [Clostridia bacterium]|nr:hypothetical protein [Clostridia bacterium]
MATKINDIDNGNHESKNWYRLDNAAKLYPSIKSRRWNALFRVSVTLKEKIEPDYLQKALEITLPRFPNFRFRIRRGLFWYYFEERFNIPKIENDVRNPCICIDLKDRNNFLFRLRWYEKRIALEVFHAITDGTGAMAFLKTLTSEYLKLKGVSIPYTNGILDCSEKASKEELEDSYKHYCKMKVFRARKDNRAYNLHGTVEDDKVVNITTGTLPLSIVLEKAKKYKVSLTEYITAVYIYALNNVQLQFSLNKKLFPVKIAIPVNMRNYYPSKTLRNFILFINPGIDPNYGEYTFEEILNQVHHFMRYELNEKSLNAQMSKNLSSEKNPLIRIFPLFLKNFAVSQIYNHVGESRYTSTLSNLGLITIPDEMKNHVERFDFILGRSLQNSISCAICTFGDKLSINFSRRIRESYVEKNFFTFLVKNGIPVFIESNQK